jgi:tetratricopeptide (TPR) repeat protein
MLDAETMRVLDTRSVTFDAKHPADFAAGVVRETAQALELADASAAIEKTTGLGDAPVEAQASYFEGLGHLFRKGQRAAHEAAIVSFTEALEPDPGFPAARAALGQAYYSCFRETNDETCVVAAERELESALSADSMLIEARVWLGRLYQQTDRIKDAVSLLESAVHVDSVSIIANEQLMSSYYTDGRYREAEELFLALQRRLPDYFGVPLALGWCYRQAGQHDMAMATYQRAFALAPTDFRTLNGLALQYSDAGDNVRARELWEQAFLARPDCGSCSNLGWVTYHEGQFRESVRWFEFALEYCDTTKFETWAYLASALYWTGDGRERSLRLYRRAIDLARKKFAEAPDDAYTAASLADFFAMVGDRENALSMIEVAAGSSDGAVLCRLAQVCEFLGDRVRALQFAGEALRRNYPLFDMTTEPFLKEMVDDPRFQQMVEGAKASAEEAN